MLIKQNVILLKPAANILQHKIKTIPFSCAAINCIRQKTCGITSPLRHYADDCCYVPVPPDHCAPPKRSTIATYCDVARFQISKKKMVIDVRECEELDALGTIPNSIHVALCHIHVALVLEPKDFMKKYGCYAPRKDADIIFFSNNGCRSSAALEEALKLGFCLARNYKGGYDDYLKNCRKPYKEICGKGCKET